MAQHTTHLRAIVPSALFALSVATCAAAQTPTYNDVVYGFGPLIGGGNRPLLIDIYKPAGLTQPAPIAIFIHGGGWQGGTHNTPPGLITPLMQQGVIVASVDYRLSGEATFPAQIHDVKGAIRYLRANAGLYGIDPTRIATCGTSAGGHLSALVATSGNNPSLEGTIGGNLGFSSAITVAADYFGPTNIIYMNPDVTTPPGSTLDHDSPGSPESKLIDFDAPTEGIGVLRANLSNPAPPFPQKVALANAVNPVTHVDANDPPIFIAHGMADTVVPLKQSQRLHDAMSALGLECPFTQVPNAGHGAMGITVDNAMRAFLLEHLGIDAPEPCTGDFNGNGGVDGGDLGQMLALWGTPARDLNGDGNTDGSDLGMLLGNWGPCP